MIKYSKYLTLIIFISLAIIVSYFGAALASDISGAIFSGTAAVTNTGTDATNVSTNMSLSTQGMIDVGYINSSVNNTAIRTNTGIDAEFMPAPSGSSSWIIQVPQISANSNLNYVLYAGGGAMDGKVRYFPGEGGMTVDDHPSLELSDNFTVSLQGRFDTSGVGDNITIKGLAFRIYVSANEEITAALPALITDNFSSDVWADVNAKILVNTGNSRFEYEAERSGADDRSSRAITTVDDAVWTLNFTWDFSSRGGSGGIYGFGIWDQAANLNGFPGDAIIVRQNDDVIDLWRFDGGAVADSDDLTIVQGTTYYVTLERNSATLATLSVFTDAGRTTHLASSPVTLAIPATVINLDTLQGSNFDNNTGAGNEVIGWHDDLILALTEEGKTVTATGVSSGEHIVAATADGTNLKIFIDGSEEDSAALNGDSVPNTLDDWEFAGDGSMPYMTTANVTVGGTLAGSWEWEYAATFTDDSVNTNTATPTFRTASSDADVLAELLNFIPVKQAIVSSFTLTEDNPLLTTTPDVPTDLFTDLDVDNLFMGTFWDQIVGNSDSDRATFWYPVAMLIIVGVGVLISMSTKSLMAQTIIMGVVFFILSFTMIPWWTMLAFIFYAMGINIMAKQFGGI
ncbi:hypothetical protein LCGC14_0674550 [marine sediment metagenome]|uniref:DUF2341 domain-containing protein n=1 Tax=marine sediment metagenome TaxID=412755 RepID=A0A0F9TXU9_9ZZZZ